MGEKIHRFGPGRGLIGLTTEPATRADDDTPAVILLNAGLVHRIGPYRMHTVLARRLAERGFLAFRFDLSGLGDSHARTDNRSYRERTLEEVAAAMDTLTQHHGVRRFVVAGLCSGAMNAHGIAAADERVAGMILLDAYGYPTARFLFKRYASNAMRSLHPRKLITHLRSLLQPDPARGGVEGIDYLDFPPRQEIEADLSKLAARGTRMLFIYTGGVGGYYNYAGQLRDNFRSVDFGDCLQLDYLPAVDHTFTLLKDRHALMARIEGWLQEQFPARG